MAPRKTLPEQFYERANKGSSQLDSGQYALALESYRSAEELLDPARRRHRIAAAFLNLQIAHVLHQTNDYDEAEDAAGRALAILQKERGSLFLQARAHTTIGISKWFKHGPAAALEHYEAAVDLVGRASNVDPLHRLDTRRGYALCLFSTGRLEEAKRVQRTALRLSQRFQIPHETKTLKRQLANTCQEMGDYGLAEQLLSELRPEPDADNSEHLTWLNSAAILAERRGATRAAEAYWDEAIARFPRRGKQRVGIAAILSNAALLKIDLGKLDEAKCMAAQLGCMDLSTGPLSTRMGALQLQAALARAQGRLKRAATILRRAADLVRESASLAPHLLVEVAVAEAKIHEQLGDPGEARRVLAEAVSVAQSDGDDSLPDYAWAAALMLAKLRLGEEDTESALTSIDEIILGETSRGDAVGRIQLLQCLSSVAAKRANADGSILLGKMSLSLLTDLRNDAGLSPLPDDVDDEAENLFVQGLINRLASVGRIPEAAHILDLQRRETARALLARGERTFAALPPVPLREAERKVKEAWDGLCSSGEALRQTSADWRKSSTERSRAKRELSKTQKASRTLLYDALSREMDGAQEDSLADPLPQETPRKGHLVIDLVPGETQTFVNARTDEELRTHVVTESTQKVAETILRFRQAIRAQQQHLDDALWLHRALLAPFDDMIDRARRIVLRLAGVFSYLPFACLFDGTSYLVERADLSVAGAVKPVRPGRTNPHRVIALGCSTAVEGFPALPFVEGELSAIAHADPAALVLRNEAFTREALTRALASKPSHLHIASHFQHVPAASHLSNLVLGDGEPLYLADLASSAFDFSGIACVTFSACDTAVADHGAGDVESLATVALAGGARSVIGSLWAVDDSPTAAYMELLYDKMVGTRRQSSLRALNAAQRVFSGDPSLRSPAPTPRGGIGHEEPAMMSNPFHWAGFIHFS